MVNSWAPNPQGVLPSTTQAAWADSTGTTLLKPDGTSLTIGSVNSWPAVAVVYGDSTEIGEYISQTTVGNRGQANTISVTTATAHNLVQSDTVYLSGNNDDRFNGAFTVLTRVDATNFTCASTSNFGSSVVTDTQTASNVQDDKWTSDRNMLVVANAILGSPIGRVYGRGCNGQKTDYMARRFSTDVLSLSPQLVILGSFVNDIGSSITATQTVANITTMITQARAAGCWVIVMAGFPYDSGVAGFTNARLDQYLQILNRVRELAVTTPGCSLLDAYALTTDTATTSGNWLTTSVYANVDKVHPTDIGIARIVNNTARKGDLKTLLTTLFGASSQRGRVFCQRDDYNVSNLSRQLQTNPLCQGAAGTVAGAGATGTAPNNYTITTVGVTVVSSVPARADGLGNGWKGTLSGVGTGSVIFDGPQLSARISAGQKYRFGCRVTTTGISSANTSIICGLSIQLPSTDFIENRIKSPSSNANFYPDDLTDALFISPVMQVPTGGYTSFTFHNILQVNVATAMTIEFAHFFVELIG
jgi:hypothetical protein